MATGKATNQTTVYYGPSTSTYPSGGSVGPNETVTLLWKEGTYYYIEYNTSTKKKRMYIKTSAISNVSGSVSTYTSTLKTRYVHTASSVYCGPSSSTYESAGSVNLAEEVKFLYNKKENNYALIQYTAGSKKKRAWIKADYLGTSKPATTKTFKNPTDVSKEYAGGHTDYAVVVGTPVYAMCDGTFYFRYTWGKKTSTSSTSYLSLGRGTKLVPASGWTDSDGNSASSIQYGHLSSLNGYSTPNYVEQCYPSSSDSDCYQITTTSLGTKSVKCGDLIGYSGNSGNSSGPHLHIKLV